MKGNVPTPELKKALRQFVDGHAAADKFIAEEQARRLKALTVEESRAEYEALYAVWEANRPREGMDLLQQRRTEELVELRRRLNLAARVKPQ